MMPAAARPPKAPPIVKPQNIMVTGNERLRSGLYSQGSVIAIGMAPPRPRPVMKRQIASDSTVVAQAEAMLAGPKPTVAKIRTALRPIRSAMGPNTKAPAMRPPRPETNSSESWGGVRFHCARSAGAMKPIAAVSKPSAATTRKQRMRTVIWYRVNGRALMSAPASAALDRRGVSRQGRDGHLHEGEQRQGGQNAVQLVVAFDIEDADVRIVAGDAPQVPPLAGALKVLGFRLFFGFQPLESLRVDIVRRAHIHADAVQHGPQLLA